MFLAPRHQLGARRGVWVQSIAKAVSSWMTHNLLVAPCLFEWSYPSALLSLYKSLALIRRLPQVVPAQSMFFHIERRLRTVLRGHGCEVVVVRAVFAHLSTLFFSLLRVFRHFVQCIGRWATCRGKNCFLNSVSCVEVGGCQTQVKRSLGQ